MDISCLGGCAVVLLPPFTESDMLSVFRYEDVLADGIVAARMKGMAARQAAEPHPDALGSAVALDGLAHVIRTGRIETAGGGQQGRDTKLIYAQGAGYDPLQRRKRRSTSRRRSSVGASKALRRGLMTMDHCGLNRSR